VNRVTESHYGGVNVDCKRQLVIVIDDEGDAKLFELNELSVIVNVSGFEENFRQNLNLRLRRDNCSVVCDYSDAKSCDDTFFQTFSLIVK